MMQASYRTAVTGWACVFLIFAASASGAPNLDVLVNAASSFSVTIGQQLQMLHSNPPVGVFAEKTIDYAEAESAYFEGLRSALPILSNATVSEEERSAEVGKLAAALAVTGEGQEKAADIETSKLLARFGRDPAVEKARLAFERAQRAEQNFRTEYDALGLGQ